jgi:hypothetical protein
MDSMGDYQYRTMSGLSGGCKGKWEFIIAEIYSSVLKNRKNRKNSKNPKNPQKNIILNFETLQSKFDCQNGV